MATKRDRKDHPRSAGDEVKRREDGTEPDQRKSVNADPKTIRKEAKKVYPRRKG